MPPKKEVKNEKIKCTHSEIAPLHKLVHHPRNANKHGERQIEILAKIIDHSGQRHPVIVSKRSGFIVAGHGRVMAMEKLGWDSCAVDYQDFTTEADEFAFLIADNKIAELAEHDDQKMISDIKELELENIDMELLGLDDFKGIKDMIFDEGNINEQGKLDEKQITRCPNCGEEFDHAKHKA